MDVEGSSDCDGEYSEEEEKEDEDEDEDEEEQETSEVSQTNGNRYAEEVPFEYEPPPCWIPNALTSIQAVDAHLVCSEAWVPHTSPKGCLPHLKRLHQAALHLAKHTHATISLLKAQQKLVDKEDLETQISLLQQELAHIVKHSEAKSRKQALLLHELRSKQLVWISSFQKFREALKDFHNVEKQNLKDEHCLQQGELTRQLKEEKNKSICCVCREKPRDTIILPC